MSQWVSSEAAGSAGCLARKRHKTQRKINLDVV